MPGPSASTRKPACGRGEGTRASRHNLVKGHGEPSAAEPGPLGGAPSSDDPGASRQRPLQWFARGLSTALTLAAIGWAGDLQIRLGWLVYTEQFLALVVALALGLTYLEVRASGERRGRVPWYDLSASLLGLVLAGYVAVRYPTLSDEFIAHPGRAIGISAVLMVLILEGVRRVAGWSLTAIVALFVCYGIWGEHLPGMLAARHVPLDALLSDLILDTSGLLGRPLAIVSTIVLVFVLFGRLLNASGGAGFFTELSTALMGRYRGGAAKIAIVASSLFGSISGSAVSNVATTGIVTIPLMRKGGFTPATAASIEAVASTGGQLMPPIMGASAFLLAEFLDIPYTNVVVAALIPALLYYAALFIQADLRAAKAGIAAVPLERIPRLRSVLRSGWFFPVPFAALVYALFGLNYPPEKAGLLAIALVAGFALAVGHQGRRLGLRDLLRALGGTGSAVLDILLVTAAASLIIGVLNDTGLSFGLTLLLVEIAQQNMGLLLLAAAVICIVLGMGMPTIGVYVLLATLVAPSMVKLGIAPIAAHLFVLYFGMMSMITPPVAIAAFAAASLAGSGPMRTAWEAMRFGWPAYVVPFLFVFSPSLVMVGPLWHSALALVTAIAGVAIASVGIVGFRREPIGVLRRVLLVLSGMALMVPPEVSAEANWINLAGAALAIAAWR